MNKDLEFLTRVIDEKSAKILDANDKIWEYAELAFHETKSAALLKSILKEEGFALTEGDAGIPTCFTGTFSYGTRKPVMGILGEYDALSSLSQKAADPHKEPLTEGAPGHGCGHCALGTGALAAALAVKEYLIANKKTVRSSTLAARPRKAQAPSSLWPAQACSMTLISCTPGTRLQKMQLSATTATPSWAQTSISKALPPTQARLPTWEEVLWMPSNS